MNKREFYSGILSALAVVQLHNEDTIYDEIVDLCDVAELVAHAKKEDELEWSGLDGYIERHPEKVQP